MSQSETKGHPKGAKGKPKGAKGSQKGAKREPTGDQKASTNPPSEKVAKIMPKRGPSINIRNQFGSNFHDKSMNKSIRFGIDFGRSLGANLGLFWLHFGFKHRSKFKVEKRMIFGESWGRVGGRGGAHLKIEYGLKGH